MSDEPLTIIPEVLDPHRYRQVRWNIPEEFYIHFRSAHDWFLASVPDTPSSEEEFGLAVLANGLTTLLLRAKAQASAPAPKKEEPLVKLYS